ncbi:D-alanine--poly(phosphoribitol) ligase [Actinomadura meridiana]|uniref:D-alanine--poly(Phosphoribitol) ligase n=1 Tax=Actinomadura meridiana TaxID=559626 RepID=A0ABP8BSX7_9ACTN
MNLHELLAESARRHPDAVAVHDASGPTTYRELDALAGRYAAALRHRGVEPGDRVVIWAGKTVHTIAVMQAALQIGAVYVPVAAANPPARVRLIVRDSTPRLVVMGPDVMGGDVAGGNHDAPWDGPRPTTFTELYDAGADPPEPHPTGPDDPAYILYTSGSTGEPKGVCLSSRNALAFVEWAAGELEIGPDDRLSNHAPFNFDLSVFDIYAAFVGGASVHLVPDDMSYAPERLVGFLRERRITVWYSVPSALSLMLRQGGLLDGPPPPDLRACVFAGEAFAVHHVQALRKAWPQVRLLNWYGPTETNVCTSYEVTEADLARTDPLPIGRECSGDTITLDPDGESLTDGTPLNDTGEVVVTGPTVMLGYWGQEPHSGPYRTGDLARRDEHGDLHYLGRRDGMVKLRGHRVELGEVEAALAAMDSVAEAAVVVAGSGTRARLHAFVVPAGGPAPSLLAVKRHCAERLPAYMTVDRVRSVAELPRTPNGKLDRARLRAVVEGDGPR